MFEESLRLRAGATLPTGGWWQTPAARSIVYMHTSTTWSWRTMSADGLLSTPERGSQFMTAYANATMARDVAHRRRAAFT
jgi:hypothetical protein